MTTAAPAAADAPPPPTDLAIQINAVGYQVIAGETAVYHVLTRNLAGVNADDVGIFINTPEGTTFEGISGGQGFAEATCFTPSVGGTGTINCRRPQLPSGGVISFSLRLRVSATLAGTLVSTHASVISSTSDSNLANNQSSTTLLALREGAQSDLSVAATALPNPVLPGQILTHSVTVTNSGPDTASNVRLGLRGLEGSESTAIEVAAGWSCSPLGVIGIPPPDAEFMACTAQFFERGSVILRVRSQVRPSETLPLTLGLRLTSNAVDPIDANNETSVVTTLGVGSSFPVPTLSPALLALLALLLATVGMRATFRRH